MRDIFTAKATKTEDADAYLSLAPALIESLKKHRETSASDYVFAGLNNQTKGKKI
jgi:hypothetical protein